MSALSVHVSLTMSSVETRCPRRYCERNIELLHGHYDVGHADRKLSR